MQNNEYTKWFKLTENIDYLYNELISSDENKIKEIFARELEFGTGGLRGKLGAGTDRMNIFTVNRAGLGVAKYLLQKYKNPEIVIAYDSRNMSKEFAVSSAEIFASQGIKVYIFDKIMPTPILSFAVRELKAQGGIVITASHNPKEYNGYKVYDETGCQITENTAETIFEFIQKSEYRQSENNFSELIKQQKIRYVPDCVYNNFINTVLKYKNRDIDNLKVVYTPLSGAGNIPVSEILLKSGINNLIKVKEQQDPDGNFSSCPYPNPEEKSALALAEKYLIENKADIMLATDPDCDRVGAGVNTSDGVKLISGNEMGIIAVNYLLEYKKKTNTLYKNPLIITTIVSSALPEKIINDYNGETKYVFTGFKNIGEALNNLEDKERFLLGMEESYGYLIGDFARDKDAVGMSMLICEMASYYKTKNMTLIDALNEIYKKYGYCESRLKSFVYEGIEGLIKIKSIMTYLRQNKLNKIAGETVTEFKDYLPKANVLEYKTKNYKVLIRPSGTEPKIKMYCHLFNERKTETDSIENSIISDLKLRI